MADRTVLVIEPNEGFAAELEQTLTSYGFGVQVLSDGNDVIERYRGAQPELVVLCLEPKKVGFAVCNKLKRNPEWKDRPVLLMSAEATWADFEQHRKLKARADEYLIKPFAMQELINKIEQLVGLPEPPPGVEDVDIPLDADAVEEIALDDSELVEEGVDAQPEDPSGTITDFELEPTNLRSQQGAYDTQKSRPAGPAATVAQQATAAEFEPSVKKGKDGDKKAKARDDHGLGDASPTTVESEFDHSSPVGDATQLSKVQVRETGLPVRTAEPVRASAVPEMTVLSSPDLVGELNRASDTIAPTTKEKEREAKEATKEAKEAKEAKRADSKAGKLPDKAESKKGERAEKKTDLWGVKAAANMSSKAAPATAAPATQAEYHEEDEPSSMVVGAAQNALEGRIRELEAERDRLTRDLESARKAAINTTKPPEGFSREREFLNLREAINRKEKEILDLKDDLDAKDRQILDHKDKIRELERGRRDLEEKTLGIEQRHLAATEQLEQRERDLTELRVRSEHEAEAARNTLDNTIAQHNQHVSDMRAQHDAQLSEERQQNAAALAAAERQRQGELKAAEERRTRELADAERTRTQEVAHLSDTHRGELSRLQKEHAQALVQAEAEKREALAQADAQKHDALAQAEVEKREALEQAAREQETQLANQKRDFEAKFKKQDQSNRDLIVGMEERHKATVDDMKSLHSTEVSALSDELAQRHQDLEVARTHLARLEEELNAANARETELDRKLKAAENDITQRDGTINELSARIEELEQKNAGYQDQILAAFTKLRNDSHLAEKARKALAVAAALLEEQAVPPTRSTGSGESQPE
jgi:CheY-like chemotaxis protein